MRRREIYSSCPTFIFLDNTSTLWIILVFILPASLMIFLKFIVTEGSSRKVLWQQAQKYLLDFLITVGRILPKMHPFAQLLVHEVEIWSNCYLILSYLSIIQILLFKVSLHTYNFCYNSIYRGIITDCKCVSSTCNSLLFSIIFGLHLSIISL